MNEHLLSDSARVSSALPSAVLSIVARRQRSTTNAVKGTAAEVAAAAMRAETTGAVLATAATDTASSQQYATKQYSPVTTD